MILTVYFFNPIAVSAGLDVGDPLLVIKILPNGFADTHFEGFMGFPAELALCLVRVTGKNQPRGNAIRINSAKVKPA